MSTFSRGNDQRIDTTPVTAPPAKSPSPPKDSLKSLLQSSEQADLNPKHKGRFLQVSPASAELARLAIEADLQKEDRQATMVPDRPQVTDWAKEAQKQARQWTANRQRAWGRRARSAESDLREALDAHTETNRAALRKAFQRGTPAVVKEASDVAWAETIAHEPRETRWLVDTPTDPDLVRDQTVSDRVTKLDLLIERRSQGFGSGWEATAGRLARWVGERSTDDAVAHMVVAWPPDKTPTMGEVLATSRRYLVRIGVDLTRQEVVGWVHHDREHAHLHIAIGRDRSDGGRWCPGIGVDRAIALEARLMAREAGEEWDQRMVGRSRLSKAGAAMARQGKLHADVRYRDGRVLSVPWQGAEADKRIEDDPICHLQHAGCTLAKLVGLRDAYAISRYCAT